MKRTILCAYAVLLIAAGLPMLAGRAGPGSATSAPYAAAPLETPCAAPPDAPEETEAPGEAVDAAAPPQEPPAAPQDAAAAAEELPVPAEPAPDELRVLTPDGTVTMDMQDYLRGVVAAEMPASFRPEALKAQAVAARSYAMYCSSFSKHGDADVCTDYRCCQAWRSDEELKERWGENYEDNLEKIRTAVEETDGEYLRFGGRPAFAAFHSSSASVTENSADVWSAVPYLVSVPSPESAEDVPGYVSRVECSPIDFRDTVLSAHPEADFSGAEEDWIGELRKDAAGRTASVVLGGVELGGKELRTLFSLRSTAFDIEYTDGSFVFTVTGFGHGVGMSQYGADKMAREGADYREILAHYYPGTELVK